MRDVTVRHTLPCAETRIHNTAVGTSPATARPGARPHHTLCAPDTPDALHVGRRGRPCKQKSPLPRLKKWFLIKRFNTFYMFGSRTAVVMSRCRCRHRLQPVHAKAPSAVNSVHTGRTAVGTCSYLGIPTLYLPASPRRANAHPRRPYRRPRPRTMFHRAPTLGIDARCYCSHLPASL